MSTSTPDDAFTVTHQEHTEEVTPEGRIEPMWTVHFETPSGTKSFIKLPDQYYTAKNVHDQIAVRVREIERVHRLDGRPPEQ